MNALLRKKNVIISFKGTKITKGIDTGIPCLVIGVSQKEDLQNLSQNDRIPVTLPNGQLTDVILFPKIKMLTSCPENTTTPCFPHGERSRPFQAGVSIGAADLSNAGTLGTFVVDNTDETLCLLTCNHVLGPVYDFLYETPPNGVLSPSQVDAVQPGVYDGGHPINDIIANGKRSSILQFGLSGTNTIDAIIAELNGINLQSPGIQDLLFPASFPFASKIEYGVGNTVYKSGRTTGNTSGVIQSTLADINVSYFTETLVFTGQIMLYSPTRFAGSGDSGSTILFLSGGRYRIVGLVFAASENGQYAFANHIEDIATDLNISAWDGSLSMTLAESNFIRVNGICYSRSTTHTLRPISGTRQGIYASCVECVGSTIRKSVLFGNVL